MTAKVRVPSNRVVLGGWKGRLKFGEEVIRVLGDDPTKCLEIDPAAVKRRSFNSNNGLWAFPMKDGKKVHLQTSGMILSADRSAERESSHRPDWLEACAKQVDYHDNQFPRWDCGRERRRP